jgi:hypothetical protein
MSVVHVQAGSLILGGGERGRTRSQTRKFSESGEEEKKVPVKRTGTMEQTVKVMKIPIKLPLSSLRAVHSHLLGHESRRLPYQTLTCQDRMSDQKALSVLVSSVAKTRARAHRRCKITSHVHIVIVTLYQGY